jgi:hypothetical protein
MLHLSRLYSEEADDAAPAAAEPAEPPRGTRASKARPRTQSRTSVSPALDRVRQAARERPKEALAGIAARA